MMSISREIWRNQLRSSKLSYIYLGKLALDFDMYLHILGVMKNILNISIFLARNELTRKLRK